MSQPREILLEGAFNMRDLGGVQTADGREIQRGKLFRADALHKLTNADLDTLAALNIATVFDFRSPVELEQTGKACLIEQGARYINIPLSDYDPSRPISVTHKTMGESYQHRARNNAHLFGGVINQLAITEHLPAVFHCAGGKDRTGITAAAVYKVLGVSREEIVANYILTEAAMERVLAGMSDGDRERIRKYPPSFLSAEAANIEAFLTTVDEEYGGPDGWLKHAGVTQKSIDSLRSEMLG